MTLSPKPWRPSFGPLPAALAGKIPVETQTERDIRRAAIRFYIDETAAIAAETDPDVAKERARRLDAVMNDAVARGRLAQLSPSAGRLMRAMETLHNDQDLPASNPATGRLDDLGSVQDGLKMSTDGQPKTGLSTDCIERPIEVRVTAGRDRRPLSPSATERKSAAERTSGGDRRPLPEVALSTRRECGVGRSAVPESCGAGTHHARPTKGGDHEDLAASGLPLNPLGKLVELRAGQGVAVFGDVAFDSRRRA